MPDYRQPDVLLPFLERFFTEQAPFPAARVELRPDGALGVRLDRATGDPVEVCWVEAAGAAAVSVPATSGFVVGGEGSGQAAHHVEARLRRLLRGDVPGLLQWRNRNPQTVFWGAQLFERLRPDLLAVGRTRWFDYALTRVDEYEGLVGLEFESRDARVLLRLTLTELLDGAVPVGTWGPVALVVVTDDRAEDQRRLREHRVEDYVSYLLSRNLPPSFTLAFERGDPPEGYRPPDWNIDFLETEPPDDTSWFQMLQASPDDGVTTVYSCDLECFNLFSYVSAPGESSRVAAPWAAVPEPGHLGRVRRVHLDDYTTIMGGDGPDRCLEALATSPAPPQLIVYVDSCLSRLLGEDVDGAVRRFREGHDVPVVKYDIDLAQEPYLAQVRTFWDRLLDALPPQDGASSPDTAAFVGFGREHLREMLPALERRGIRSAGTVFPQLDLRALAHLGQAGLLVLNEWDYVSTVFAGVLDRLRAPRITLPLPYGFAASVDFVDGITRRLGLPGTIADDPEIAALRARFEAARAQLDRRPVTLVGRAADVEDSMSPSKRFGIPVADVLRELGLGLDILLYRDPLEPLDEPGLRAALRLDAHPGDRVRFFSHWRELPDALRDSPGEAVYTETYRDRRVTAAGKTPLTLRVFEPGFRGAIRTAENVLDLVNTRFYASHAGHLGDPWPAPEERP
ncbi:MAG: nitrogenase component 1 [Pseudomonadota bacterium]